MSRTLQMPAFCSFTTLTACNFAVLFTAMIFVSLPSKSEQMAFHNMLALSDNELIRHYPANTPYAPESPSNLHPMFEKVGSGEITIKRRDKPWRNPKFISSMALLKLATSNEQQRPQLFPPKLELIDGDDDTDQEGQLTGTGGWRDRKRSNQRGDAISFIEVPVSISNPVWSILTRIGAFYNLIQSRRNVHHE